MSSKIFTLTNFSPIGFKEINYPVQFCTLCRGRLVDVCSSCIERNNDICNVINTDGSYFHYHCYNLMNNDNKNPAAKAKQYLNNVNLNSDSDSDLSSNSD